MDTVALRDLAVRAAAAGSDVVRRWVDQETALEIEQKGHGDYVTAADRAAEAAVLAVLQEGTPGIEVLAEESGGRFADECWVVDPIDGTTNFLRGYSIVGVSVGLLRGGRPHAGCVAAPLLAMHWSAGLGLGAHDHRGRPIRVREPAGRGVVSTGFPFRRQAALERFRPALLAAVDEFEDLRRAGAASLDLAHAAAGIFDGHFELGLAPWDVCAGGLLVREAGGVVTDWEGDADAWARSGDILAGSPAWHGRMLALVAGLPRS